jgi:hypothetical protein
MLPSATRFDPSGGAKMRRRIANRRVYPACDGSPALDAPGLGQWKRPTGTQVSGLLMVERGVNQNCDAASILHGPHTADQQVLTVTEQRWQASPPKWWRKLVSSHLLAGARQPPSETRPSPCSTDDQTRQLGRHASARLMSLSRAFGPVLRHTLRPRQ